jgi:hypothetical protein
MIENRQGGLKTREKINLLSLMETYPRRMSARILPRIADLRIKNGGGKKERFSEWKARGL